MPDILYDRPGRTRQYMSFHKHQQHAPEKYSKWLDVNIEKLTFDTADYGDFNLRDGYISWIDLNGNMWGFLRGFPDVGTSKQQFAYFQNPNNPVLRWHGFPAIPFSHERYNISDQLLERWVNLHCIDEDDIPNIRKKRRI